MLRDARHAISYRCPKCDNLVARSNANDLSQNSRKTDCVGFELIVRHFLSRQNQMKPKGSNCYQPAVNLIANLPSDG